MVRSLIAFLAVVLFAAPAIAGLSARDLLLLNNSLGPSLSLDFTKGVLDQRVTFSRASSGTYFDNTGTLQTATSNVPRFDYDPVTHAPLGLLIELQSTNLLLNNATLSTQSVAVTATAYTLSFYGTGTVTLSGASAGSLVGTGAFPSRAKLVFTPAAGTLTLTVSGNVQSAQLEQLPFATSVIATSGSAVTRASDNPTIANGLWFNQSLGTQFLSFDFGFALPNNSGFNWELMGFGSNGTNIIRVFFTNGSIGPISTQSFVTTGSNGPTTSNNLNAGATNKVAMSYDKNALVLSIGANGVKAATAAVSSFPATSPLTFIGGSGRGATWVGHLKQYKYWPRKLSSGEFIAVTK